MTSPSMRLIRASLFALVVASGLATIRLVAQDVCGNPLECFEPGQESEMWQALTPFGQTNDQVACINSLHPDPARDRELPRQCQYDDPNGTPYPVLMPPKLGWMLDPFMLAVDGERIYVSDQSNHRIQAFLFDGTPVPIAHPIGDGVPGSGAYGPYPADPRLTGTNDPITGVRLDAPDGIAVDAAHKLVVGDASGFISVFNADGTPAFGTIASPQRLSIPKPFGMFTTATGIAMTPGTIVRGFGVPPEPGDTGRIVVTDRFKSFVFIYDSGFNLIKQVPEQIPANAEADTVCVWSETAPLGTFCTPVMAAIDAANHIYISEYDNNRIQVLNQDGAPISYFGSSDLQYPWGISLDHNGRLLVADTENQRIAVFGLAFPNGADQPPLSTFQFELDAKGTLNGYPTGVVEQAGSGSGLDPAGRILVTDTLNNRVQRFQLPDLAIINPQLDLMSGNGTFQVVVPAAKTSSVANVGVSATGVNATVLSLNGVAPANTTALNPANTALQNATAALGTTIAPGQAATYQFTFSAGAGGDVSFVFDAVGNGGATAAEPAEASVAAPCTDCVSTLTYYQLPSSGPPVTVATPQNGWFNTELVARVDATSSHPSGLSGIAYQFLTGPEASGMRWGGSVHVVPVSGAAASIDIDIVSEGVSTFRYWAIGGDGTVEGSHFASVSLDLTPPNVSYSFSPAANAAGWNSTPVSGTYTHADGRSGAVFTGIGTFSFPDEGRGYYVEQTATDLAGNTSTPQRSDQGPGGRPVNIDMHPPVFDSVPANVTILATGPHYGVVPAGTFNATAHDPDLIDPRANVANKTGSGVVSLTNPGTNQFPMGASNWAFTATDAAGNIATVLRTVTVIKSPSSLSALGASIVYGDALSIPATISPAWATGSLMFTLDDGAPVAVALSGGTAARVMPVLSAGNHTLVIDYPGSASVEPSSTTISISVAPRPITARADNKEKAFGAPDPALTYRITSGSLVAGDAFVGSLSRGAGEMPGDYVIGQGTLALSANYALTFMSGRLTILSYAIGVFADDQTKTYGDPDYAFTFHTDVPVPPGVSFTGQLGRTPSTEAVGNYTITQGTLALPSGFELLYHSATLKILPRQANVVAGNASKTFGSPDPAIPVSSEGFLAADEPNISISATRVAGENVGTYSTLAHASGAALANYQVGLKSGTFSISPYIVTVMPHAKAVTYGDADPAFDFDYSGFPPGYSAADIVTPPTCAVAVPHANAGTYPITCGGAVLNANFEFHYATATLTVAQRAATLRANDAQKYQGDPDPVLTTTATNFLVTDGIVFSATRVAGEGVGTYAIAPKATGAAVTNYDITLVPGTFTIIPSPNLPPVCSAATGGEIWPPNHKKFYAAPISGVTDPEGGPVAIVVTGIWQDEPVDSTGDGKFSPDGQGVGTSTAWVRAERNGQGNKAAGNGRVYEILFTATDDKGASCSGSVFWTVPHDKGQRATAIDSGVRYDSTAVIPGARDKSQIHRKSPAR